MGDNHSYVHYDTFTRLWRKCDVLRKIVICPPNSGFAECSYCGSFRRKLENKDLSSSDREKVKAERKAHMDLQRGERETYALHREMANREPEKYVCAIFDGMTLDTTTVPHLYREDKVSSTVPLNARFVTRLFGVKLHHAGETQHFAFMFPPWVGHGGSNTVLEALCRLVDHMGPNRPAHLFIQVDNCSENKSKTLLALADKLVKDGMFETVQLNYLMVGHTHEDIDQWFSVFSKAIAKEDIWTVDQMFSLLQTVSENDQINPKLIFCSTRHDFTSWLASSIDPELGGYCRDPAPHEFIFSKINGEVLMRYKPWSRSEIYQPTECAGIKVLINDLPWSSLQYDAFDFKWDEEEKCLNAVRTVVEQLCQKRGIMEEWLQYWSAIPQSPICVADKWSAREIQPRNVRAMAAAVPDVPTAEQEYRNSRVLVSHAFMRKNQRKRVLKDISEDQRLRLEADHAKTLVPLEKDVFVIFKVEEGFYNHRGFTKAEQLLRIGIGKLISAVESVDPDFETQLAMFRCASGDPNKRWMPAIKEGTRTAQRIVGIPRGAIIFHAKDVFTSTKQILASVKKDFASYYLSPYEIVDKSAKLVVRKEAM